MNQIEAGVDQRAVEVEDYELDGVRVEGAAGANHRFQNKALGSQSSAFGGIGREKKEVLYRQPPLTVRRAQLDFITKAWLETEAYERHAVNLDGIPPHIY